MFPEIYTIYHDAGMYCKCSGRQRGVESWSGGHGEACWPARRCTVDGGCSGVWGPVRLEDGPGRCRPATIPQWRPYEWCRRINRGGSTALRPPERRLWGRTTIVIV